ncbi:hypothetical protein BB561_005491 [Smittium simulii]|uniref:Uncharacterized protein n=1 Tax=Smittium simulii TaxID=133385 RepID=A0A2T9YA49_9FUNG|nr:hypothetical protein BB561_005491 [Smittium simulii]
MYIKNSAAFLAERADIGTPSIYLNLVFYSTFLKSNSAVAKAYVVIILLCIIERLLSYSSDLIPIKIPIYFVVTMLRYAIMIAIMTGYIPLFMVICGGLALGQTFVEISRYIVGLKSYDKLINSSNSTQSSRTIKSYPLVDECCC